MTLETLDVKVTGMAADVAEIKQAVLAQNGRVRQLEKEVAVLGEQQRLSNIMLTAFSAVASALAAWLGVSH